jgi:hypothetical protein
LSDRLLGSKTSTALQTTLAAEAHLAEGQFLLEEQTLSRIRIIYAIERNGSKCKDIEIFTHHVGSIGAPSRRTVFVRGTSAEQREFPEIAGRNTKANIF